MMIHCPRCQFLQEEDVYCARCGVNMQTWTPPSPSLFRKFLDNWILQLLIFFGLILAVVINDSFSKKTFKKAIVTTAFSKISKTLVPMKKGSLKVNSNPLSDLNSKPQGKIPQSLSQISVDGKKKRVEKKDPSPPLKRKVYMSLYMVSRSSLDRLLDTGQGLDGEVSLIDEGVFQKSLKKNQGVWVSLDSMEKSFLFNEPQVFFIGEKSSDMGKNLGFYFKLTVFDDKYPEKLHLDISVWSQLKIQEPPEDEPLPLEITIALNQRVLITSLISNAFTDEERAFFESSSALKFINNESFVEGVSDIVLVIGFK